MKPHNTLSRSVQFRLSVKDVVPEIWRRLLVSTDITLMGLHYALQIVMGWGNRHLYAFVIDAKRYSSPSDADESAENRNRIRTKLSSILAAGTRTIMYEYDFGDEWQILLNTEAMDGNVRPTGFVECIGGSRHGPVEDSGGSRGYMEKALIYKNPQHKRFIDVQEFIGPHFDPEAFDLAKTNVKLKAIA